MSLVPGQALLVKATFADGGSCESRRPFLIIANDGSKITALNVSSLEGKESKLTRPSNKRILLYKPPFAKASMVKLDACYEFEMCVELNGYVLASGRSLAASSLQAIQTGFAEYKANNIVANAYIPKSELIANN